MTNEIVGKLNTYIHDHQEIDEAWVTYFLVEIRKIIEHKHKGLTKEQKKEVYPVIKFYADWALHIIKNRVEDFVDYVEEIADALEIQRNMSVIQFVTEVPRHALAPLIELEAFKQELVSFLNEHGIDISLVDTNKWFIFRNTLSKILHNQPLIFADPISNLQIKEISFLPTNKDLACVFLISIKNAESKELGPYIFGDDNANTTF